MTIMYLQLVLNGFVMVQFMIMDATDTKPVNGMTVQQPVEQSAYFKNIYSCITQRMVARHQDD